MRELTKIVALGVVAGAVWGSAGRAWGGISFVNMFRNDAYTQTGNGNALTFNGSFVTLSLFSQNPGDYSGGTVTFAGSGSPAALTPSSPTVLDYSTSFLASRAAMNAAFPTGTYTYTATNGVVSDQTSFTYVSDAYSSTVPYLTGTNYSDLQGMNPTAPFAFTFSPFTPDPAANEAFVFFTLFNEATGDVVYDGGFGPATKTGVTLPGGVLMGGVAYAYELIYSDRVETNSPGAEFAAQIGFDIRTAGTFTPRVVPEVGVGLWMVGFAGMAPMRIRRGR